MTIIEFFDKNAIENVISSLLCNPDKVVFIGYNRNAMKKAINKHKIRISTAANMVLLYHILV